MKFFSLLCGHNCQQRTPVLFHVSSSCSPTSEVSIYTEFYFFSEYQRILQHTITVAIAIGFTPQNIRWTSYKQTALTNRSEEITSRQQHQKYSEILLWKKIILLCWWTIYYFDKIEGKGHELQPNIICTIVIVLAKQKVKPWVNENSI